MTIDRPNLQAAAAMNEDDRLGAKTSPWEDIMVTITRRTALACEALAPLVSPKAGKVSRPKTQSMILGSMPFVWSRVHACMAGIRA